MDKGKKLGVGKNIILLVMVICLISILLLAVVSCNISIVGGSGNVISEDRNVSGFSKISLSGSGKLYIEQGNEESLTVKAEDNLIPLIKTEVSGNTLSLGTKFGTSIIPTKSMEFYLKVKELISISVSGSGNINCSGLATDDLSIRTSGSSKVDLSNLKTTSININSSGSSSFNLEGITDSQDIKTSGSVKYFAEELKSNSCVIDSSGSGQLEVNVSVDLDIKASGSTKITYIGNPTITQKTSGSVTIKSKQD
jgi:hypothetical protein